MGTSPGISYEYKASIILDLLSQKVTNARDIIFYKWLNLAQFREDEETNANRVYANEGHSHATPQDEAAAAILEEDRTSKFPYIGGGDDDDDDSNGSPPGASGAGGSSRDRAPQPLPPEPEGGDDDVKEVITQHRHNSIISILRLMGLHTATSSASRVIKPKNLRQAFTEPYSKEWREAMDAEIKALESRDTYVLVDQAAIKGRKILSVKWVFRMKTATYGTIECFKTRWAICGYD
ncbi:unnamed protein product [Closterium sp. NIES-53]